MNLSDLQNPIANMPHVQQMRAGQESNLHQVPVYLANQLEEETEEKLTTVRESNEEEESDNIRDEEERGGKGRGRMSRRAKPSEDDEENEKVPARLSDGIHGFHLDIQA